MCKTALDLDVLDIRRGTRPAATFFDLISSQEERGIQLPLVVIVDPSDVTSNPDHPSMIVASGLNDYAKINFLVGTQETTAQTSKSVARHSVPTLQSPKLSLLY